MTAVLSYLDLFCDLAYSLLGVLEKNTYSAIVRERIP